MSALECLLSLTTSSLFSLTLCGSLFVHTHCILRFGFWLFSGCSTACVAFSYLASISFCLFCLCWVSLFLMDLSVTIQGGYFSPLLFLIMFWLSVFELSRVHVCVAQTEGWSIAVLTAKYKWSCLLNIGIWFRIKIQFYSGRIITPMSGCMCVWCCA